MIQTILGEVSREEIGYILGHEHMIIDLSHIRNDKDSILDNVQLMVKELLLAKESGLTGVVDVTNIGMGRNIDKLVELSKKTKLQIIASTGYYQDLYYTSDLREVPIDEIAELFIKEINIGIESSNHKAGVIGEIGTSFNKITKDELKVFKAAAMASKKTFAPIFTHCELGTMALEQVEILLREGVLKDKILIGHMDLVDDIGYLKKVLKTGVNIAFDTVGKTAYVSDLKRIERLLSLIQEGYEDKIILSLDITRKSYLKSNNGHGYNYMFESFIPKLRQNGINESIIKKLLRDNLLNLLDK